MGANYCERESVVPLQPAIKELTIRPYAPADRKAVLRIAADTAAFGAPVEMFLDDRRLFGDAVYRYYVDYEPEHAWVAAAGGEVTGFLVGCADTRRRDRCVAQRIGPAVALNLLCMRYRVGRRTLRHAYAEVAAAVRREFPAVDLAAYPAHLHINLDARWRGQGAGRRLMEAFLGQLHALVVPGVHLRTTSLNTAAVALYTRLGFELLDARSTRLWAQVAEGYVENRCYGLRLNQ
jgi:ribosomal protein S18 acetylase RimI-like enzyme